MKASFKKILSVGIVAVLAVAMFAGCGGGGGGGNVSTGLGIATSIGSSKPASADAGGTAQVDSTIAVVSYDASGKITKCSLDVAQTRVGFDATGAITADLSAPLKTKQELGADYGMTKASGIGKEWFEQAKAFSDWAVGKTLDQVKGLKVKQVDENHTAVPDVPELTSSVTITVGEYIKAIEKAMTSTSSAFSGSNYKTGLGVETKISSSKPASAEAAGVAQVDSAIAAVTLDKDGKIAACIIDAAQTRINFDAEGKITSDLGSEVRSKIELGADYGMLKASGIGKEWYEQIQAFAKWTIGKTPAEVSGLKVKQVDDNHKAVPDVPDLTSSVTITVGDYIAAVMKAAANAG